MSLIHQLLRAGIMAGSPSIFRDIAAPQVLEEEAAVWTFAQNHYRQYGVLPTVETLGANGHQMQLALETPAYYVNEIRKRFAYQQISERHPNLTNAMRNYQPEVALATIREMLAAVGHSLNPNSVSNLNQQLGLVLEDFDYAREHPGLRGIPLGWDTLDHATLGAQPGDLIVIAGRPSMGKSYLLLKAARAAWLAGHSIAFVSMEMSLMQIARRWIAMETGINPRFIQQGALSPWAESTLRHKVSAILEGSAPCHFLAGDMEKNIAGIEAMVEETNPSAIYIDAAYLLSPSIRAGGGYVAKWEQISMVIKELKQLAVKWNRPIIITVQFNRNLKSNATRELDMGDIGGSDSIPQDSSVVIGAKRGPSPHQNVQRILEIMKNREGETKSFACNFQFTPMDFNEIPYVEPIEGAAPQGPTDVSWMGGNT